MMTVHAAELVVTKYHTLQLRKPTILTVIETESQVFSTYLSFFLSVCAQLGAPISKRTVYFHHKPNSMALRIRNKSKQFTSTFCQNW